MTDAACVHPAVALVDEPGLGRTMRAVERVECGALLLHEAPITVTRAIDELPEPLQATYRAVSAPLLPFSPTLLPVAVAVAIVRLSIALTPRPVAKRPMFDALPDPCVAS